MAHQTTKRRASAADEARDREVIAAALARGQRPAQQRAAREPQHREEVRRLDGGPVTEFNPTWRGDERGEVM